MTDITTELRNLGWPLCHEAADEIKRLFIMTEMRGQEIERHLREKVELAGLVAKERDEVERLRALVEDALRGLHNDFEPDNQSALYNRIRRALEPKL